MFVPVADRAPLLARLRSLCRPGGAIVVFDKTVAPNGYVGTILRRLTMCWKLENGATPEDIVAKELSLSGVQRPLSRRSLPAEAVEFFTFGEFAGVIVEGPET